MECAGTMRRGLRFRGWEGSSDCLRYWKIRQDAIAERGPSKLRVTSPAPTTIRDAYTARSPCLYQRSRNFLEQFG